RPADDQHRARVLVRGRDRGHGVRHARPRGHDGYPAAARQAPVALGGMAGDLLVPGVDDADAFVEAAVVDVLDVPAAQREDRVDPLALEHPGDEVAAVDLRHAPAPRLLLRAAKCTARVVGAGAAESGAQGVESESSQAKSARAAISTPAKNVTESPARRSSAG